ncbi:MAG: M48 family metalloprotease [Pseudomonadota bacterium]
MIKLLPLLVLGLGFYVFLRFAALSSGSALRARSRPLSHDTLEAIVQRLAHAAGIEQVEVRVLEDPIINGVATPDGGIYVTAGLLQRHREGALTAPEVGSVVAHELGHLALGHTRRRMIEISSAQTASVLLGGLLARVIPFIGWYLAQMLISLFVSRLSRRDEFEADAYATALMLRSGLGHEPQASMLEKLERLVPGARLQAGASWLASHPPVQDRAAAIRENARRWQEGA